MYFCFCLLYLFTTFCMDLFYIFLIFSSTAYINIESFGFNTFISSICVLFCILEYCRFCPFIYYLLHDLNPHLQLRQKTDKLSFQKSCSEFLDPFSWDFFKIVMIGKGQISDGLQSTLRWFWIKLQNPSKKPMQDEKSCIWGS